MKKGKAALLPALLACIVLWNAASAVRAEEGELTIEQLQSLLQESLTITEIDREVQRLSDEEIRIKGELDETAAEIETQTALAEKLRKRAGKVLRSYYTGDRQNLWLLLFRSDSFSNAIKVFQYLQTVAENDRRSMDRFLEAVRALKDLEARLEARLAELAEAKAEFLRQRERLLSLQAELDRKLAEVADREKVEAEMAKLANRWQNEGLPYFQSFLEAMSGALVELPDYVNDYPDSFSQERRNVSFTVREQELNTFLRNRNALFNEFYIALSADGIRIEGSRGALSVRIDGHFEVVENPDPALRFTLDRLYFGDFDLPDTTIADMQRRFPMTFSTSQHELTSFLVITGIEHLDGTLRLNLKIDI